MIRALVGVILFQSAYVAEVVEADYRRCLKGNMKRQSRWRWLLENPGAGYSATGVEAGDSWLVNTIIALFKDTSLVIIIGCSIFSVAFSRQPLIPPGWVCDRRVCFRRTDLLDLLFQHVSYSQHLEKRFNTGRTPH